jgi:hypothetical protein
MFYSTYGSNLAANATSSLAATDASYARSDAREAKTETELMRHDVDRLLLITEALWGMLKKEHGYTDDQLADAVKEIDLRDGRLDGRPQPASPVTCPGCQKVNSPHRTRCIYCGQPLPVTLFGS